MVTVPLPDQARVKTIEYYPDGSVKRVEYHPPVTVQPYQPWPYTYPPYRWSSGGQTIQASGTTTVTY